MKNAGYLVIILVAIFIAIAALSYNSGYIIHFLFTLAAVSLVLGFLQEKKSRKQY